MAAKILSSRKMRHLPIDSSVSSPELEEKYTKWTLFRAPLQFSKESSVKMTTTPPRKLPNVLPTSTPCLRVAPPFQLSQTLLSPVSKERSDDTFEAPKSEKPAATREHTFDNLLTSQIHSDTSSKIFVNKRAKPLQGCSREADVERTRQYAGARTKCLSTESSEANELISSPVMETPKVCLPLQQKQERYVSQTVFKPDLELGNGKVCTDVVKHSQKMQRLTTEVDLKGHSKRDVPEKIPSETDKKNAQKRINLRTNASPQTSQLGLSMIPSKDPGIVCNFDCSRSTSAKYAQNENGNLEKSVDNSNGSQVLQVKRRLSSRAEDRKRRSDVSLRQVREGLFVHTVARNSTSNVSFQVEQKSSRRRSSLLSKSGTIGDNENLDLQDELAGKPDEAAADPHLFGEQVIPRQIQGSGDEEKKELEAKQRNVDDIMNPILSKTSTAGRKKEKTVSGERDVSKMTDEIASVLKTQKSLLKIDGLEESSTFLINVGLIPSEYGSPLKGDITQVIRAENKSNKDLEENIGDVCHSDGESIENPKEGVRNGLIVTRNRQESCSVYTTKHGEEGKKTSIADHNGKHSVDAGTPGHRKGKDESTAGRNRKKSSSVDNLGHSDNREAGSSVGRSCKESCSVDNPEHSKNREAGSTAGRSRKESTSIDSLEHSDNGKAGSPAGGDDKRGTSMDSRERGDDGNADPVIKQSRFQSKSRNSAEFCQNGVKDSTLDQSLKEINVAGTKHIQDTAKKSMAVRRKKENRAAYCIELKKDKKAQQVRDSKGQEMSDDGIENTSISTGPGKRLCEVVSDRPPKKVMHEKKIPKEDRAKKGVFRKKSFKRRAYEKISDNKTDNILPENAAEFSGALNVFERPRRERRPPGSYWVPAAAAEPHLTPVQLKICSQVNNKGIAEKQQSPAVRHMSGTEDNFRPKKIVRALKRASGQSGLSRDTTKSVEKLDQVTQTKKRRLLPKKTLRISEFQALLPPKDNFLSQGCEFTDWNSKDGVISVALISHVEDIKLVNKNTGLPSENPNIRIGPTVSWNSISGSLVELQPGSVSGPQVDVLGNQVFIVMEGTVVLYRLGEETRTTLNSGDSAVVPAGRKFSVINNSRSLAILHVLRFIDVV